MFEIVSTSTSGSSLDSDASLLSTSQASKPPRHYKPKLESVPTFSSVFPSGPAPPPSKMFLQPPRRAKVPSYTPSWRSNDDTAPLGLKTPRPYANERSLTPAGSFRTTTSATETSDAASVVSYGTGWKREVLNDQGHEQAYAGFDGEGVGSYESGRSLAGSVGGGLRRYDGLEKGQGREVWRID